MRQFWVKSGRQGLTASSLDQHTVGGYANCSMRSLRIIVDAVVALSLAALPVSAVAMPSAVAAGVAAGMPDASDMAAHTNCCAESKHCEKQPKNGCGESSACLLKCTVLSAAQVAAMDLATPPKAAPKLANLVTSFRSTLDHPALPPPRV